MGKMLGGEGEEKDPDAAKKEEERQEALRQQEDERKGKYAKMEAERENIRQGIRDKGERLTKRDYPPFKCCTRLLLRNECERKTDQDRLQENETERHAGKSENKPGGRRRYRDIHQTITTHIKKNISVLSDVEVTQ
ncbi:hypothetical protein JOQ06_023779, partial [Pogonophryne albipinna]